MITLLLIACLLGVSPAVAQQPTPETYSDPKGSGVKFTRPDGTPIYVNPHAVAFVRSSLPGEHGKATIVFSSGAKQQVLETVEQVIHGIHIDMPEKR
jgi:uncharacterized protein YlzI (FlbEa/FlbD family)